MTTWGDTHDGRSKQRSHGRGAHYRCVCGGWAEAWKDSGPPCYPGDGWLLHPPLPHTLTTGFPARPEACVIVHRGEGRNPR